MKKIALAMAAISAIAAGSAPAYAQEARVEVRGGVLFDGSDSDATAGLAVGADFDLGNVAFIGAEASLDKVLNGGTQPSIGLTGRLGVIVTEGLRAYGTGGYHSKPCDACVNSYSAGAGAQYSIGESVYLKAEYRHFFVDNFSDYDAVLIGIGFSHI